MDEDNVCTQEVQLLLESVLSSSSMDITSKHEASVHAATWLDNLFTVDISKAKVEMFHQVGVSHDHVKDISSSGFHLTLDQDALTVWHHHVQLSLSD